MDDVLISRWSTPIGLQIAKELRLSKSYLSCLSDLPKLPGYAQLEERNDFRGLPLSGGDLQELDLTEGNLDRAAFSDADISNANLSGASLRSALLSRCTLASSIAIVAVGDACTMLDVDLQKVDGSNSSYRLARFQNCCFDNASFQYADFSKATFQSCSMKSCNFRGVHFSAANFIDCTMVEVDLEDADLSGCRFKGTQLKNLKTAGAGAEAPIEIDDKAWAQQFEGIPTSIS